MIVGVKNAAPTDCAVPRGKAIRHYRSTAVGIFDMLNEYLIAVRQNPARIADAIKGRFYDKMKRQVRVYSGLDGITSIQFRESSNCRVRDVITKVLSKGRNGSASRFTFTPFKRFFIPKPGGAPDDLRPISAASINSIICQTPISEYLVENLDHTFANDSFGYRKGRSAKHAVALVKKAIRRGAYFVLDADIEKFFDSVDHEILMSLVKDRFPNDDLLHTLIRRYLKTGYVEAKFGVRFRKIRSKSNGYVPNVKGIPQGGILSGLLANLYLDDMDKLLRTHHPKVTYVRYADDFVVLSQTRSDVVKAAKLIQTFLKNYRALTMHREKTRTLDLRLQKLHGGRESFDFLGYRFTAASTIVKPKNMKIMKARLSGISHAWSSSNESIDVLIFRLTARMEGRMFAEESELFLGRNWVRYFSLVSHVQQLKDLDSFIVKTVRDALRKRGFDYSRAYVLSLNLPSFVHLHHRMKKLARRNDTSR